MMVKLQNSLPVPDELDVLLIQELEKDARTSYVALASKLGVSQPTIYRRLNKLIDRGVIRIITMTNHAALGYRSPLVLAINAPHGMVNTLADRLASINEIKHVWITSGRYDILAVAYYRSHEEFLNSFCRDSDIVPESVRMETILRVKQIKNIYFPLTEDIADVDPHSNFIPTELDLSVIRGLEKSPRIPVTELAQEIGASLSYVRSSLHKLTFKGIIRVVGIHGPNDFRHKIRVNTLLQIHPPRLMTATSKLGGYPFVNHVTITLGAFNCLMGTSFENSDQMSEFLAHDLANMPGVLHSESLVTLKIIKEHSLS